MWYASGRPGGASSSAWGGRRASTAPVAPRVGGRERAAGEAARSDPQAWPRERPGAAVCVQGVDDQCVLQFTLVNAAGCALHRCTSQVIHRSESRSRSLAASRSLALRVVGNGTWGAGGRGGGGLAWRDARRSLNLAPGLAARAAARARPAGTSHRRALPRAVAVSWRAVRRRFLRARAAVCACVRAR